MNTARPQHKHESTKVVRRGPKPGRVVAMPLRALREAAGKTQAEAAAALGTDQAEISRLERRSNIETDTLRAYARALDADFEIVFVSKQGHRVRVELGDDDRPSEPRAKRA